MKLDLIAIGKLSPAGLWDLAELATVISTLVNLIRGGFGGDVCVRRATSMVKLYRKQLHDRTLDNFNIRAKAWVLQCPQRIAHVRGVIGEAAIRRWQSNRFLDYALTEKFGDWKKMFPKGLSRLERKDKQPRRRLKPKSRREITGYNWKPFALVKIPNAERILRGQAQTKGAIRNLKTTQPRQLRPVKPVRFRPDELAAEAATGAPDNISVTAEPEKITIHPLTKIYETEIEQNLTPPQKKPP